MYLPDNGGRRYYDRNGEQRHSRGNFLILMQSKERPINQDNMRAIIKKVALTQLGHWMMGEVKIGKNWYTVSGTYGGDGLPLTVQECDFLLGTPVPKELYEKWNTGGGWNDAGSELKDMIAFAKTLLKKGE